MFMYFEPGGFRPTQIPGLNLWLDAADTNTIASTGALVDQWSDKSGNSYNYTRTGASRPSTGLATQNGKNVITFGGSNTMQAPAGALAVTQDASTIFVVANSSVDNAVERILRYNGAGGAYGLSFDSTSGRVIFVHGNSTVVSFNNVTKANYNIIRGRNSGTTQAISVNGQAEVTNTAGSNFTADTSGWIGATLGSSQFLTGNIAEVIIFSRSLSDVEMAQVERYLARKWNITLINQLELNSSLTSPELTFQIKQGIASDGTYFYASDNNELVKYDTSWNELVRVADPIGAAGLTASGANHLGDITVNNGIIYVPAETYPNDPFDNQWITMFSATDLSFIDKFDVSAQATEISGLEYNSDDGLLYASSFVDGTQLLKYNPSDGSYEGAMPLSLTISAIQGLALWKGFLWISSSSGNVIHKFTTTGTYIGEVYRFNGFTESEGLAAFGEYLVCLAFILNTSYKAYFLEEA